MSFYNLKTKHPDESTLLTLVFTPRNITMSAAFLLSKPLALIHRWLWMQILETERQWIELNLTSSTKLCGLGQGLHFLELAPPDEEDDCILQWMLWGVHKIMHAKCSVHPNLLLSLQVARMIILFNSTCQLTVIYWFPSSIRHLLA